MSRNAHTISVYVLIPEAGDDPVDALAEIQAGIERACGNVLSSGYLIEVKPGIPPEVSDRV